MYNLVEAVKQAAVEAINNQDPMSFRFGKVIKVEPLEIWIDQKLTIPEQSLILTSQVSNYSVEVDGLEGGKRNLTFNQKLKVGEKVILIRVDGGQKYIVLDRAR